MLTSRHYWFLFVVVVVGGMTFVHYQHRFSKRQVVHQDISHYKHSGDRVKIRGFQYDGHYEGKRIISIKGDQFTIEKKKLSFFRLGLTNVARFKGAVIDIYGTGRMSLEKAFTKEALSSFPAKRISSIVIEAVKLNLHNEKFLVTQISASSATIRFKKRDILFEGNVKVVSGPKSLETARLMLLPESAVIKTDRHFVLKTPERQFDGEHLTTDMFLGVVKKG